MKSVARNQEVKRNENIIFIVIRITVSATNMPPPTSIQTWQRSTSDWYAFSKIAGISSTIPLIDSDGFLIVGLLVGAGHLC